jgi:small-conductance mechanosensitive channel
LGTLTGSGLVQSFTPSPVVVVIPNSSLNTVGVTEIQGSGVSGFFAGDRLAVQLTTSSAVADTINTAIEFAFEITTP